MAGRTLEGTCIGTTICKWCGEIAEIILKYVGADPAPKCPQCGGLMSVYGKWVVCKKCGEYRLEVDLCYCQHCGYQMPC